MSNRMSDDGSRSFDPRSMDPCSFDETLITGYIDRALPQQEAQKARLHLEDCDSCRKLHDEFLALREAALSTRFAEPDTWPELPKTLPSRFSRSLGWTLLVAWLIVAATVALWRFVTSTGDPLVVFLGLGLPGGLLLLFLSVLLDRLRELPNDRYRRIQR